MQHVQSLPASSIVYLLALFLCNALTCNVIVELTIRHVLIGDGERHFLRVMLTHVRGATSFANLRTVDGVLHPDYKHAAIALGVFEDDGEWERCLQEAADIRTGPSLRELFATCLLFGPPSHPEALWQKFRQHLLEDYLYHARQVSIHTMQHIRSASA